MSHRVAEAVWRMESAKIVGGIARRFGDVGLAEEAAQDALVTALETWPVSGVPDNPGAWLMTVAQRVALDRVRRDKVLARKYDKIGRDLVPEGAVQEDWDLGNGDVLALMFVACHPVLSSEARVTLTLRLVGGLTVEQIARAFLVPAATIAQRILRAKRVLAAAKVPFELPIPEELTDRLSSVLEVIYLIFNEGYSATAGDDLMRPELCEDASRLGRVLAGLAPSQSEVHGLVALMELQSSRTAARTGQGGELVPLLVQDRSRWDPLLIGRGLAALDAAEKLPGPLGPYGLQAAITACHARAPTADDTDWERIAALYEALVQLQPSPIVELNRAVAVGKAYGAEAGLEIIDALASDPVLANYHLLPSVRGDLLVELGRHEEARREFKKAAALTRNRQERDFLMARSRNEGSSPG